MKVKDILDKMSLRQKIGQLTQYNARLFLNDDSYITGPEKKLSLSKKDIESVGSVLNFFSVDDMKKIQDEHLKNDPCKIPIIFMLDVIHGYRTIYPIPLALACSFDPDLTEKCARMAAAEAAASGVHVTFAPMADYVRDARWGRVMESAGEDPLLSGSMAAAQVRGFQGSDLKDENSIAACVKHFAAYGASESGRDYNLTELSQRELREYHLPAYKAALDAGAQMVMPSFQSLNGIPSTANPMLHDILRNEWNFDGTVISDYNAIGELIKHGVAGDETDAVRQAFACECDMEMCSATYFHCLEKLIEDGEISMEQIDRAVCRVLTLKERLGLFDDPYHGADKEKAEKLYLSGEHRNISKTAACESAVLLKNNGILPFNEGVSKVAVIGPFADEHGINGFWSCCGKNEDTVTVKEGIESLIGKDIVFYARGCGAEWNDSERSGLEEATALAREADAVILCLGEPQNYSGEGNCRTDIRLPGIQEELARLVCEANPNVASLVFNGRPLDLTALEKCSPAILEMWFPGTEGGNAAAELLFGRTCPSGKLSMSFPRSVGQCPVYYNRVSTARPHWTDVPESKGYASDYIDCGTLPLYSFGYGLSYTEFIYEEMKISGEQLSEGDSLEVVIRVKNNGSMAASEVVQLYMRDPVASAVRPVQQLIGFKKVSFEPFEVKNITFTVTEETFRFYNYKGEKVSEKGEIILMTGCPEHFYFKAKINVV